MICFFQRTIKKDILIEGIGLHTGEKTKIKLIPSEANRGIIFVKDGVEIPASVEFAKKFDFSTSLERYGKIVNTIEHLLSALYFTGIDNIYIEVEGSEIPILDGSAYLFIEYLKRAGIRTLKEEKIYGVINKSVKVKNEDRFISAKPYNIPKFTYHAVYKNEVIGDRKYTYIPSNRESFHSVSKARTYCFIEEVEYLKKLGLAKGGSLENAVVFDGNKVLNPDGLRYKDEPVRHKLLDLLGDLYLFGYPLWGDVYSYKGGHRLNAEFVKELKKQDAVDLFYASEVFEKFNIDKNIKVA